MISKLFSVISLMFLSACNTSATRPTSDHFDGKVFFNPHHPKTHGFTDFLKMLRTYKPQKWPKDVKNKFVPSLQQPLQDDQVAVTFVNHATVLIQTKTLNILTDPVWSERVSPVSFAGPKRVRAPGIAFDQLPRIDLVIVSHNHYDHMDIPTLKKLWKKFAPQVIVPLGNKALLESYGIKTVTELDWWESTRVLGLEVSLGPAQHFSSRGLFDRNKTLWGSFWIQSGNKKLFFAGDTGYGPHFQEIYERFGTPDISFLPIGAYEPNWFMKAVHMNPAEAVRAHQDLHSKQSIGIHFGTFQLTEEAIDAPVIELQRVVAAEKLGGGEFVALGEGQTSVY